MQDLVKIPQGKIQELEKTQLSIVKQANDIIVSSADDVRDASVFLKRVKDSIKGIDTFRLSLTKPLHEAKKSLDERFRELTNPLKQAEYEVSSKIVSWKRKEDARIAEIERRRKIQEAHVEKGHEIKTAIEEITMQPNTLNHAQFRKVWVFTVTDFSKIPDKYKVIDRVAVNNAIRNRVRNIEGIKISQEERVAGV